MNTKDQLTVLGEALLEVFPNREKLAEFSRLRLGVDLEWLVPANDRMWTQVSGIIDSSERAGKTADLVRALYEAFPKNEKAFALYRRLGLEAVVNFQQAGTATNPSEADTTGLERIISQRSLSQLDPIAWRERLLAFESQVCRVEVQGGVQQGTGFLIGPDVVLTCYHLVDNLIESKSKLSAADVSCRFDYRIQSGGVVSPGVVVGLDPSNWLIDYSPYSKAEVANSRDPEPTIDELDYAVLRLARPIGKLPREEALRTGVPRGWIQVPPTDPQFTHDMPMMILSYAQGGPLKLAVDSSSMIGLNENGTRVRYRINSAPGSGGAPCLDFGWNLVAMHHMSDPSPKREWRQGIPIAVIRNRLNRVGKANAMGGTLPEAKPVIEEIVTPEPGPIVHDIDPQRDRWGKKSKREGRMLSGELVEVSGSVFTFNAIVTSIDDSPLEGPVIFHLHDTYPRSVIDIRKIKDERSATLNEVNSYGVYTIGAQVKNSEGHWIGLEYCLTELPNLPTRFLSK